MAFRFPFYGFPFPYNRYNYYNYNLHNSSSALTTPTYSKTQSNNNEKIEEKCIEDKKDEYFFDLFGIHLYFDDILLICLIFFLYSEGVKDEGLFMALILLLLT